MVHLNFDMMDRKSHSLVSKLQHEDVIDDIQRRLR
jgi:hypothetical protein